MEVQIANPIYDVVFKYMMEDNLVARLVVSSIIGEQVVELEPRPQEHTTEKTDIKDPTTGEEIDLTVYRLDFSAKIKTPDGHKLILIEMQKALLPTDIVRFRGYLGEQFSNADNVIPTKTGKSVIQIYCLYFLGKDLGICQTPVLEVNPIVRDCATSRIVKKRSDFIESLHHRSWIIQINCLKDRRRNDVEQLLGVFDQSFRIRGDNHILNIREEDFPEKYWPVIRRLKSAASNPEVKKQMKQEDEWDSYVKDCIRIGINEAITKMEKNLETERKKNKAKDAKLKAKNADLKAKEIKNIQLEADLKTIRTEKDAMTVRFVINSHRAGLSLETISTVTGLTTEEILKIIERNQK